MLQVLSSKSASFLPLIESATLASIDDGIAVLMDFFNYFTAVVEDRKKHPTDDLASVLFLCLDRFLNGEFVVRVHDPLHALGINGIAGCGDLYPRLRILCLAYYY